MAHKPKARAAAPRRAATRRCRWAQSADAAYVRYHDEEWGKPVHDDRLLFEMLILEGAQAGLSWATILRKRAGYLRAFANFDPGKVAGFDARRRAALRRDPGIVRNRLKIEATVSNASTPARTALSDQISKDLIRRGFRFVGSTIIYAYLQAVGVVNDHARLCFLHARPPGARRASGRPARKARQ